ERPDQVRRVLEKLKNEGILQTIQQVRAKLDEPMSMGYSSAGVVLACGKDVQDFKPGDRVASNGPHAEIVCVPKHLCAKVPERLAFDQAAFTVLGAIALQGIRLSRLHLGETAFVIGLGLVGQLTVALLKSAGVRVIATDLDSSKCSLAEKMGAAEARTGLSGADIESMTRSLGADAVIITASAASNQPIELAVESVRKKGRIVLVGVVGLQLNRRPFYFKECEFVVSSSYGPGRYDADYEERGRDYPAPYVRWTEQRNMQAVLDLMGSGSFDVSPLISHRFPIDRAEDAYRMIENASEPYLGIILEYPGDPGTGEEGVRLSNPSKVEGKIGVGCLGAGNYARMVLLPALKKIPAFDPGALVSAGGLSAASTAQKLGFQRAASGEEEVLSDPQVDAVFVLTQHDAHAGQVVRALSAGKHVFTEKPLCLTVEELQEIESALAEAGDGSPMLMVGYNRRFSPAAVRVKAFFENVSEPVTVAVRFNAGAIPPDHWTQDSKTGGGRIVGEACHAIDLATFLTGSLPVRVYAESV
ncbi:MAG: bi-domain-containing oxidoreductase, partial [Acidobacteriota bacterium]